MTDPRETNSNELTEAGTCRMYVTPKLVAAGWDNSPHEIAEQHTITDGKIYISVTRLAPKSPTYSPTQTKTLGAAHHSSVNGLIALLCPLDTKQSKIIATL